MPRKPSIGARRQAAAAPALALRVASASADIALALRTIVIPTQQVDGEWVVDLQAGAGIVLDSDPTKEFDETMNKSAALRRAVDLAERAFGARGDSV